jgi:hypothetical protein
VERVEVLVEGVGPSSNSDDDVTEWSW